jgi:hypothetical protein
MAGVVPKGPRLQGVGIECSRYVIRWQQGLQLPCKIQMKADTRSHRLPSQDSSSSTLKAYFVFEPRGFAVVRPTADVGFAFSLWLSTQIPDDVLVRESGCSPKIEGK